ILPVLPSFPPFPPFPSFPRRQGGLEEHLVHVTPAPVLAPLEAPHDRMPGGMEVLGGVPPGRLIAAADVATLLAEPEMHPATAGAETLLTPVRGPGGDVPYFTQVLAFLDHGVSKRLLAIGYWLLAIGSASHVAGRT